MSNGITETDRFLLFWKGWPSQWHRADFTLHGITYNCCEQYMMAEKARIFGDDETLAKILAASDPRAQKSLGRKVRNFDNEIWTGVCRGVVYTGNLGRFSQGKSMGRTLLATGNKTIVEASPVDPIWGIGLAQDDPATQDPSKWRGTNWLGIALMQVRATLSGTSTIDAELAFQIDRRRAIPSSTTR